MNNNEFPLILKIIISIGAVIVIIGIANMVYELHLLKNNNKTTIGVVTERQYRRKGNAHIVVHFSVNNRIYRASEDVDSFEKFNDCYFNVGDSVIITYYPPDPTINEAEIYNSFLRWKYKIE